ncbi:hypothetical protein QBC33DRAFT_623162 [Phialemonium atrogriseum]|uniref:Uncharacterized protein n=1 Tax=Phialemonium atrogriseum TaxID=1093897 RepID=A0AAJ0BU31_9PEZI|nr:uncharacterized protein QBC33DRAFT_623162 [Phialemonium atrogriseum]KAK1763144.1 hypothetical protein QBC33DRAFT_623162 [Phialemonium atrogriseum]
MGSFMEDCQALIDELYPLVFVAGSEHILIEANPRKILQDDGARPVALYAQSLSGQSVYVNMRLPGIKRVLSLLAKDGVGQSVDHKGVRYQFVMNSTTATTSLISSLG